MKKLLPILLLFSCTKTVQKQFIIGEDNLISATPERQVKGRANVIYLNFTGKTVNDPNWNGGQSFYCSPYPYNAEILARVQQHYAAYKVTITATKPVRGSYQEIIITPTTWRQGVSGVALNGSMFWNQPSVAFVFTEVLSNNANNIGEIAAHESGHTIGLNHQTVFDENCNLISSYREGFLMGNSLGGFGIWGVGTTYTCQDIQNDNAFLVFKLGLK